MLDEETEEYEEEVNGRIKKRSVESKKVRVITKEEGTKKNGEDKSSPLV